MALLYQEIMKVPGLSGTWQQRLKEFGKQFYGGSYTGNSNQNNDLLKKIQTGNFGIYSQPAPQTQSPVNTYTPPAPQAITPFDQVMPLETIFPKSQIEALAMSQIKPEINRQQTQARGDLMRNLGSTGAYRTGHAGYARQNLNDTYARQLKEQTAEFSGNINNWITDWYNQQSEGYYKDPTKYNRPALPTINDFISQNPTLANNYNNVYGGGGNILNN